ncbi:MAG TPA: class I SAM-dependent methyltransferase [Actinomycetota bacterium]|nr:class I SAM-dependent methyltransferase [Actinomycetota bacterium]
MTVLTDPEGDEKVALLELADFDGADVLEIGCGDGRLTWRYADRAARVTAIDAFEDAIARAESGLPEGLRGTVRFRRVAFEDFSATTESNVFDVTILSWSLC